MKALVIYHGNCDDGFGAAWAFHHLKEKEYTEGVIYHPAIYGEDAPVPLDKDTDVWILDFSYPIADLLKFCKAASKVYLLDHHKTAVERFNSEYTFQNELANLFVLFDMSRSGAMITWDYLNTSKLFTPSLINHIQDRDLWKFELVETKAYTAALRSYPQTFKVWDDLVLCQEFFSSTTKPDYKQFVSEGEAILRYFNQQCLSALTATKREITIDGIKGLSANLPPLFASDAGNILAEESGTFGLVYFINQNGHYSCSLRSIGDFDVSAIAQKFGGGGHKNAAGFSIREISYMNEIFSPHHIANSVFEEMKKE